MATSEKTFSRDTARGVAGLDLYAAVLSALCIIHCLALPFLVSIMALSVPFSENEAVHIALVLLAAPATLWVIYKVRGHNRQRAFIAVASAGLVLLLAGTFAPPLEAYEEPLTVVGAMLLGSAHLWHWFQLRSARRVAVFATAEGESAP